MGYYINGNGEYYEGDKSDHRHIEVPKRPSPLKKWDGSSWVDDPEAILINKENLLKAKAQLSWSVRAIVFLYKHLILKGALTVNEIPDNIKAPYIEMKALIDEIDS